jgi:hypothetical protein
MCRPKADHFLRVVESDGNARLGRVSRALDRTAGEIGRFLKAHPDGCPCVWCGCPTFDAPEVRADLTALQRVVGIVASSIVGLVLDPAARV